MPSGSVWQPLCERSLPGGHMHCQILHHQSRGQRVYDLELLVGASYFTGSLWSCCVIWFKDGVYHPHPGICFCLSPWSASHLHRTQQVRCTLPDIHIQCAWKNIHACESQKGILFGSYPFLPFKGAGVDDAQNWNNIFQTPWVQFLWFCAIGSWWENTVYIFI